jgi:alpha-beta hydrolase superfamily lysophospholipase
MKSGHWEVIEGQFTSWDGAQLFTRTWKPQVPSDRAIIVVHRGHEHSGRLSQQIEDLGLSEFWAFSWDCRGHGRSPGKRGHAQSYYHLVKDLDAFVAHVAGEHGIPMENIVIVANSVGAVTTSAWVHDYAPRIRGMVLAAPAFRIRLYVPLAVPLLRLLLKVNPAANISSYVKSRMLTHDREQSASYDSDLLITRNISVNILLGLHDTSTRIMADAGAIVTPTLLLSAGSDWVVKNSAQKKFFESLNAPGKEMQCYPGFFHAVLYEKDRHKPIEAARKFILEAFTKNVDRSTLLDADKSGYTKQEYDRLQRPAVFFKRLWFGMQKLSMRTTGRLSTGIRIGCETGFDSGTSLDYVYENTARGVTFLGRIIDRLYLDAVGWRGIRERGENLKRCLAEEIERLLPLHGQVQILDVATGCGRYVLDVIKMHPDMPIKAILQDNTPQNIEAGKQLAASLGVDSVLYRAGDAFDREALSSVRPRPNIVIVSGLYELFADNFPVRESLGGIADVLVQGGSLIYTGQPWHPQIEMIARTCDNRDGKPWIMRRRTQAELDELVRQAGFTKTRTLPDSFGIFTVSIARKA